MARRVLALGVFMLGGSVAGAAPAGVLWQKIDAPPAARSSDVPWARPHTGQLVSLDFASLGEVLREAPLESQVAARASALILPLPMPNGTFMNFRVVESPIMEPELAAKYPEFRTYLAQGIDDPTMTARFDRMPSGFHAYINTTSGVVSIDPYSAEDTGTYTSFYLQENADLAPPFLCGTDPVAASISSLDFARELPGGDLLRTYRVAIAANGEFTQFYGGTVAKGLGGVISVLNRINEVLEQELSVRLILVANNERLIFTDPDTDPYANGDSLSMMFANQSVMTSRIGLENFDVGHVFGIDGGGVAGLGALCDEEIKWAGMSGTAGPNSPPVGDSYSVSYAAHEFGHQLGANHTFNTSMFYCFPQRNAETAFEPGSGSTIMSYCGVCPPDNVQASKDSIYHWKSYEEVFTNLNSGVGGTCARVEETSNTPPFVEAGPSYSIPRLTPFVLTATGGDADGDSVTYNWEQADLGPAAALGSSDTGQGPLFKSVAPSKSGSRYFPALASVLASTGTITEILPQVSRQMKFVVTARDNHAGNGGRAFDRTFLDIVGSAGPFRVTSFNTADQTASGTTTVTWSVAGTDQAPINVSNVKISLSIDAGQNFDYVLAESTPNDGEASVFFPPVSTDSGRIKIEAVGNVFYDVNNRPITIVPIDADSPEETFANLRPGSWVQGSVPSRFDSPEFDVSIPTGLRLETRTADNTFGYWQTARNMFPLPPGIHGIRVRVAPTLAGLNKRHPEVRVRAFRADSRVSSMALLAETTAGGGYASNDAVLGWVSDGATPWGLATDLLSFSPDNSGGFAVTSISIEGTGNLGSPSSFSDLSTSTWEFGTAPGFSTPGASAGSALVLSVNDPSNTFGYWQTKELSSLAEGKYRIRFQLDPGSIPGGTRRPEVRARVFRADNRVSAMSVAAETGAGVGYANSFVDVIWYSDGASPWRMATDILAFGSDIRGSVRVTGISITPLQ